MSSNPTMSKRRLPVFSGLSPYTGVFGTNEVVHLLKRTMFGASKADIDFFKTKTLAQSIAILMTPEATPTTFPIKTYNSTSNGTDYEPNVALGATWVNDAENGNVNGGRATSLRNFQTGQMLNQGRSIHQKMLLFWQNHFATQLSLESSIMAYQHYLMLRRNSLGNFKTFVKEVTIDPMMLYYLNGYANQKTAPDENYGRELQELFCCGKSPESLYTEDDVKAAAKVLTGWQVTQQTVTAPVAAVFNQNRHDTTNKTFSAFYGGRVITGRTTNGNLEVDDLLSMIFATQEVAKFVCRELYRFFVYYEIDATTETNVILPLATIFRNANYDIVPVLNSLLGSQHFFDVANQGCVIKSPLDYCLGLMRELGVVFPTATNYTEQNKAWSWMWSSAINGAQAQGQLLFDPPNVAGWPAYYEIPQYHELWVNTDSYPKRLKFVDGLFTANGYSLGNSLYLKADVLAFAASMPNPSDPNKLVSDTLDMLFRVPVSQAVKDALKNNTLLSGNPTDAYWTAAWNQYIAAPTNATYKNVVLTRVTALVKYLCNQPEFHLS
jgi:uncharacterized protein (DUF1800 family)